jgi:hypothetical protein
MTSLVFALTALSPPMPRSMAITLRSIADLRTGRQWDSQGKALRSLGPSPRNGLALEFLIQNYSGNLGRRNYYLGSASQRSQGVRFALDSFLRPEGTNSYLVTKMITSYPSHTNHLDVILGVSSEYFTRDTVFIRKSPGIFVSKSKGVVLKAGSKPLRTKTLESLSLEGNGPSFVVHATTSAVGQVPQYQVFPIVYSKAGKVNPSSGHHVVQNDYIKDDVTFKCRMSEVIKLDIRYRTVQTFRFARVPLAPG